MYYVNPASVYALAITFPVICTASVILRFKARRYTRLAIGKDDWVALLTLIPLVICAIIMIIGGATHTMGYPTPSETPHQALYQKSSHNRLFHLLEYVFNPVSILAVAGVRLTFALLYRRIFRGNSFDIISLIILAIIVLWTIAFFFATFFTCHPINAFWGTGIDYAQYCKHNADIFFALAISDVAIDLSLLLLPIKPILKLQLRSSRKAMLVAVFSLGIFSIAAGFTRMILLAQLTLAGYGSDGKLFGLEGITDPWQIVSTILWWGYLEIGVGCLASNLPPAIGLLRSQAAAKWIAHRVAAEGNGQQPGQQTREVRTFAVFKTTTFNTRTVESTSAETQSSDHDFTRHPVNEI